jgi:hypothetical protein
MTNNARVAPNAQPGGSPMIVNIAEAKANLSKLINRALHGEKIVIVKNNMPLVASWLTKCRPMPAAGQTVTEPPGFVFGFHNVAVVVGESAQQG